MRKLKLIPLLLKEIELSLAQLTTVSSMQKILLMQLEHGAQLFSKIGLKIPVTIEPVSVVNWMESPRQRNYEYPIIADYTNFVISGHGEETKCMLINHVKDLFMKSQKIF